MPLKGVRLCLLALLAGVTRGHAVEQLLLETERIEAPGMALEKLKVTGDLAQAGPPSLQARADALRLGEAFRFESLSAHCPRLLLFQGGGGRCDGISVSTLVPPLGELSGTLDFSQYSSRLELRLDPLKLGRGVLKGRLAGGDGQWDANFRLRNLELSPFFRWLLPQWDGSGKLQMNGQGGIQAQGWNLKASPRLKALRFSDREGLKVGEGVEARASVRLRGEAGVVKGKLGLVLDRGQLYMEPFYVEVQKERPLSLDVGFEGHPDAEQWILRDLGLEYPGVLRAGGSAELLGGRLARLDLEYQARDLGRVYSLLLQPLLIGTAADELQVQGKANGVLAVAGSEPRSLVLNLENVQIEDAEQRYGFTGLQGRLRWKQSGQVEHSTLGWQGGHLYRVQLGSLAVVFLAQGGRLEVQPFTMQVLEGSLHLRDLEMQGLLGESLSWQAGLTLNSIRLEALSRALEWPPLEGEMNAVIPRVHYRDGRLQLDGNLVVEIFGGRVVIEGLRVEDPFGVAPVLETSIRLENLDLKQISQTFSFGRIEGSLEGSIRDLRLVGWELSGFDALLRSPPKDRRRHRISQRAIDNLTELGNGVAAGLSGTFLGMFKDFAYDRLQLSIRLKGDTALLDGAPGPEGGYYIVKGARLPRVDVIGRNRRVAWKDLLSRLKNIRFEGVVVE